MSSSPTTTTPTSSWTFARKCTGICLEFLKYQPFMYLTSQARDPNCSWRRVLWGARCADGPAEEPHAERHHQPEFSRCQGQGRQPLQRLQEAFEETAKGKLEHSWNLEISRILHYYSVPEPPVLLRACRRGLPAPAARGQVPPERRAPRRPSGGGGPRQGGVHCPLEAAHPGCLRGFGGEAVGKLESSWKFFYSQL